MAATLVEALTGRALGKAALGLRVMALGGGPARLGRLAARWTLKWSGAWLMLAALVAGWWPLALAALVASWVAFLGGLGALGPRRLSLHDRLAGTRVEWSR